VFFDFGLCSGGALILLFYLPLPPSHPPFTHLSGFPPFLFLSYPPVYPLSLS
jgi:hypothetical protein